jgi:hypothetical protein
MKVIQLTQGQVAIVDDQDFERLAQWRWYCSKGYAARTVNRRLVYMHRAILGDACKGKEVDHKNRNTLDNRRENLRAATVTENHCNSCLYRNSGTGFKGVSFDKRRQKFYARVAMDGSRKHLGHFPTAEAAHAVYCAAAKELHGEFARFN